MAVVRLIPLALLAATLSGQNVTRGTLLVATAKSHDPDFAKSVVLIVDASRNAAVGIIVNRPGSGGKWVGGPVPLGTNALVRTTHPPRGAKRILPDVFAVAFPRSDFKEPHRVYTGTCGWTTRQLKDEFQLGLWRTLPGSSGIIFDEHPETLWDRQQDHEKSVR